MKKHTLQPFFMGFLPACNEMDLQKLFDYFTKEVSINSECSRITTWDLCAIIQHLYRIFESVKGTTACVHIADSQRIQSELRDVWENVSHRRGDIHLIRQIVFWMDKIKGLGDVFVKGEYGSITISEKDNILRIACKGNMTTNTKKSVTVLDSIINAWGDFMGISEQFSPQYIPLIIEIIQGMVKDVVGVDDFMGKLGRSYNDHEHKTLALCDKRCDINTKDGILFTHLLYWANILGWISDKKFIIVK